MDKMVQVPEGVRVYHVENAWGVICLKRALRYTDGYSEWVPSSSTVGRLVLRDIWRTGRRQNQIEAYFLVRRGNANVGGLAQ